MTDITRREIIVGAAATTAAAAIVRATGTPLVFAASPEPVPTPDPMETFVSLSGGLTGIQPSLLAPTVDTAGLKKAYFDRANRIQPEFTQLLAFYNEHKNSDAKDFAQKEAINAIFQRPDFKTLCYSIILAWYLGVWHDPQSFTDHNGATTHPQHVVSAAAYTQGWIWRIMQAHPMGYSNLEFGHWKDLPKQHFDLSEFMIKEGQ
jgi:hypothetical protein